MPILTLGLNIIIIQGLNIQTSSLLMLKKTGMET